MSSTLRRKHLHAQARELAFNMYQWIKSQSEDQFTKEIREKVSSYWRILGRSDADIKNNSPSSTLSSSESSSTLSDKKCPVTNIFLTNSLTSSSELSPCLTMDRSVDSIGACSLDADVSINLTDWSEQSSVGTLRSISITTPEPQSYLPSYLSLACTVSGYSTTTNYDPERLSKSRDASPHRHNDDLSAANLNKNTPIYNIRNNLLSPPNLVPLPHHKYNQVSPELLKNTGMEEKNNRQDVFTSTRVTTTYNSEMKNYSSSVICKDTVDDCIKNHHEVRNRCISFESKGTEAYKEFESGIQHKSFIQQRVERLYGPGALAQGFFISKRQKNYSESDQKSPKSKNDNNSISMSDKLVENRNEGNLKQSTSSPTLPVLRHLRPEFRAQLPIICPKKNNEIPKSQTVPILREENKLNWHANHLNGIEAAGEIEDDSRKDGHYFLCILETESNRLLSMADKIEKELEELQNLSEDVKGKLRSASGKARLLVSQKMQQFRGLCTNNLTQKVGESFPTTNEDLQGFWDMVLLQVEQVNNLFKDIDTLRDNNWIEDEPMIPKVISNGNVNKTLKIIRPTKIVVSNNEMNKEREIKRKQLLEERRRAMRQQKPNLKGNIEIFVPESS
ncbi:hypothetical protein FQA39_LY17114 [Lamprigera yunnana]|nr:hypothetical protein FQA39_LY17114 [Lamprigera yunnana]